MFAGLPRPAVPRLAVRADVKAHVRDGAVDIGERTPQIVERATGGRRKDDIGVAVAVPHFDVGLAERDNSRRRKRSARRR